MRLLAMLLVVTLLVGCASKWDVTPEEIHQFTVECEFEPRCFDKKVSDRRDALVYERDEKRMLKHEEIVSFIRNCALNDMVLVYSGFHSSRWNKNFYNRRTDTVSVPRGSRIGDFQCGTQEQVMREMNRVLGGY